MPTYSQAGRILSVTTPLGADKLLLERVTGTEGVSRLYRYDIDTIALASTPVAFDQLLGQSVTVAVVLSDNSNRYINGIVSRITAGERFLAGNDSFIRYHLQLVPRFWLLSQQVRSRLFQQMTVQDILKKVLSALSFEDRLQGTYPSVDYCTQYQESDFAFACRLMEDEGISYYFEHANGSHKLILVDSAQGYSPVPGPTTITYEPAVGGRRPDDRILTWTRSQEICPGKVTLWDQCFELPGQHLDANQVVAGNISAGTVSLKKVVGNNTDLEVYEYPGGYAKRFDGTAPGGGDRAADVQKIFQDNARTAKIRLNQEQTPALVIEGSGLIRYLATGHTFTLANHPDANGDYVLTEMNLDVDQSGVYTSNTASFAMACAFRCVPKAAPYVPPRLTHKPRVPGPQTAVVVGPSGEEIFTDKYSRVKVQFPWDRDGKKDADSSCWVRVGTPWAGKQWGMIHIPRIGQEVIVSFEDGDPDRPIIVGSVYNADQMPPYTLPDNKTQSGLKTRSTLQGDPDTFNELRFEDKKDSEDIYFHAQKDFHRVVENDDDLKVGHDQTIEIKNDRTETVKEGNEKVTVATGTRTVEIKSDETLTVKDGNRLTVVEKGNDTHEVKTGNRLTVVDKGNDTHQVKTGDRIVEVQTNDTLTVKTGNLTIKVNAGKASIEAATAIELKVGSNVIKIEPSGITIQGMTVKIEGQAQTQVKAPITQVNGDGMLELKGGVTMIN